MKFKGQFLVALLAGQLMAPSAFAYFEKGNEGQEVFSFSSTFESPRNAALENAAAALPSSDPTITQQNPAALLLPSQRDHVVAIHWQTGDMAENVGSVFYTGHYHALLYQISYNWLDYGDIDGYDEFGEKTGKTYKPMSQMATATVAYPMKHIRFGFTFKFLSDELADEQDDRTALAAAFDWGIAWQADSKLYGFALTARDFGCVFRDYVVDDQKNYFPMAQTFSLSGYMRPQVLRRLTLYTQTEFPRFSEPNLELAGEYALGKSFNVRLGFTRSWLDLSRDFKELTASNERPSSSENSRMLSAGLGYTTDRFSLDYSFSYLAQGLGSEHRIGLRVGF